MLKILSTLGFGFAPKNIQENKTKKPSPDFGINGSNLAPLACDTVSFGGRKKTLDDKAYARIEQALTRVKKERYDYNDTSGQIVLIKDKTLRDPQRTISVGLANAIYDEALADQKELKSILENSLKSLKPARFGEYCTHERPIYSLEFRTKSPNSIREKASQKSITTRGGIKESITDIVGARIILGDGRQGGGGDIVIGKLAQLVKDGKLDILEIESHTPADTKYKYASQASLTRLANTALVKNGFPVSQKYVINRTGYTAVHILVRFADGYTGEIQILGYDVARLKELEDIPYKILQGKACDPKYNEIKKALAPLLFKNGSEATAMDAMAIKLRQEFTEYTAAAYKHEREKGPMKKRRDKLIPEFLTIREFKQMSKKKVHLPDSVDFNNLYKLKTSADA